MVSIVGQVCGIYKNINKFRIRVYHIHGCPDAYIAVHPELNDKYHVADKDLPILPYDYGLDSVCKLGDFVHLICPTGYFDRSTRVIGKVWDLSELSPELQGMATEVSAPVQEEIVAQENSEPHTSTGDPGTAATDLYGNSDYDSRFEEYFGYPLPHYVNVSCEWASSNDGYHTTPHLGIDLAVSRPTPVYSVGNGTVLAVVNSYPVDWHTEAHDMTSYGNYVTVDHGIILGVHYYTHYAHLMTTCVSVGDRVDGTQLGQTGTQIGQIDNTGHSFGDHLHFEVINQGNGYGHTGCTDNPRKYIKFNNA